MTDSEMAYTAAMIPLWLKIFTLATFAVVMYWLGVGWWAVIQMMPQRLVDVLAVGLVALCGGFLLGIRHGEKLERQRRF